MTFPTVRLGDVVESIRNGLSISQADNAGGLPITRIETISSGVVDGERVGFAGVCPGDHDDWLLHEGDVLVSHINSMKHLGKCAIYEGSPPMLIHGMNLLSVRADPDRVAPRYLFHVLSSPLVKNQIPRIARQSVNQSSFGIRAFSAVAIPLPPLPEQRRIAAIIDKADAVRRKRQQTRDLGDQFLRSAFLDMFGDPVTNPNGWPKKVLGGLADIQGGVQVTTKRGENPIEVPYLRVANVYRDTLDLEEIKSIRVTAAELERVALQTNDVLIVEGHGNRNEIGRSAVWDGSVDPCVHQNHLIRVRPEEGILASQYLSFYLNSAGGRRQMLRSGKTTSGLNTISTGNVKETNILLPPIEEQDRFIRLRADVSLSRCRHVEGISKAEVLLGSLTQRAFRGDT